MSGLLPHVQCSDTPASSAEPAMLFPLSSLLFCPLRPGCFWCLQTLPVLSPPLSEIAGLRLSVPFGNYLRQEWSLQSSLNLFPISPESLSIVTSSPLPSNCHFIYLISFVSDWRMKSSFYYFISARRRSQDSLFEVLNPGLNC